MDLAALLLFASALLVAAASPGPGIAALIARVIGSGHESAYDFAAGLILGDLVWLAVATLGLAVVAQTFHEVFLVIKYAGAAYLIYLAYRMWTAKVAPRDIAADRRRESHVRLFVAGLALTLGNPKVVAFYLALLPNLIDLARVGVIGYVELASVSVVVLTGVFGAYIVAATRADEPGSGRVSGARTIELPRWPLASLASATRARALFRSTRAMRLFNRAGGTMMAGAAVAVATR